MTENEYIPFSSRILDVIPNTGIEYTFRMEFDGAVRPGQFFEVSMPKFGEAPISVSGMGDGYIDLTIRRVGKVTNEVFEQYVGERLFLRGPYGNGFNTEDYRGMDLIVATGGTGLSPVRGLVEYFSRHPEERGSMLLIASFRTTGDVLFTDDIERWKKNMDVIVTISRPNEGEQCTRGRVTDHIPGIKLRDPSKTAAIVVGPPPLMQSTSLELLKIGVPEDNIWLSQERRMCCGLGKCGHCRVGDTYICLDGPVFKYSRCKDMLD